MKNPNLTLYNYLKLIAYFVNDDLIKFKDLGWIKNSLIWE